MDELKKGELIDKGIIYYDEKDKLHISIPKATKEIMKNNQFITLMGKKQEEIYFYHNPIWKNGAKQLIYEGIENLLEDLCTSNIVKEVEAKIKRKTFIDKEEFERIDEELICLENGILNLVTGEIVKDNPEYYFKTKLPIKFNEEADCPKIKAFFEEIFYPEDIPVIQEWIGFCLYRRYFIKKAMILVGEKNTGKTVFLNILNSLIGNNNTSGINLQRISMGDKFGLSSLKGKLINLFDDLSSKDLSDGGGFKIATGGGYITAEYKFGDSFQFMNYAKHIFATNKIPPAKDTNDDAYYERWLPIQLDNQCPVEKQDPFLLKKIITAKELSGILNWAIIGLRRLLVNGRFSYGKNSEEIKYIMERNSHPLASFIQDRLVQVPGNRISKDLMFQAYTIYCNENKLPRLSKSQLGRQLENYCYYVIAKHNTKERYWENVDFII